MKTIMIVVLLFLCCWSLFGKYDGTWNSQVFSTRSKNIFVNYSEKIAFMHKTYSVFNLFKQFFEILKIYIFARFARMWNKHVQHKKKFTKKQETRKRRCKKEEEETTTLQIRKKKIKTNIEPCVHTFELLQIHQ